MVAPNLNQQFARSAHTFDYKVHMNLLDMNGRHAVITGGAGGLGRALATQLQARGWFCALLDLPHAFGDLAANPAQSLHPCDVTDAQAVAAVDVAEFMRQHREDFLVVRGKRDQLIGDDNGAVG